MNQGIYSHSIGMFYIFCRLFRFQRQTAKSCSIVPILDTFNNTALRKGLCSLDSTITDFHNIAGRLIGAASAG